MNVMLLALNLYSLRANIFLIFHVFWQLFGNDYVATILHPYFPGDGFRVGESTENPGLRIEK